MMKRRTFLVSAPTAAGLGVWSADIARGQIRTADTKNAPRLWQEQLVTARADDKIDQAGLLLSPSRVPEKTAAIVWIHGSTANFYYPSYVAIARATAPLGYTFILGNTRMHDIGCVLADRPDGAVWGGAFWGLPSQEPRDVAAWVALAQARGHSSVVLIGHSAGGPAVRRYMAKGASPAVIGWGQASVGLGLWPPKPDEERLRIATEMVAEGRGQYFLPNMRLSAATFLDFAQRDDTYDFYGIETATPAISRVRTPLLAFYGSKEDVGTAADLQHLRELIAKHPGGPTRIDTAIIEGAEHDYTGKEVEVAELLDRWVRELLSGKKA
jgi:alpha-beta hydrolase superfamily lysophospholipase